MTFNFDMYDVEKY